jgi:DNA anti-recombination protein RmuC
MLRGAIHEDLKRAERNPAIRGKEIEKQSDQIGFANEGIRASLDELKRTENRELGEASTEDKRLEQESSELEAEEGGFPQWTREQDRDWRAEQDRLIREEEGSIRILERDTIEESGSLEHRKEQLRTEFEELRRRVTETVANRSVEGGSKLAERIKAVLSNGEHLASIAEAECDRKRTKSIVQDLRSGKFETWYRPS